MPAPLSNIKKTLIISVIADESTVTGFLLTGIGQRGKNGEQNYCIVNKDTTDQVLEQEFGKLLARDDIGIILIAQSLAERVRSMIVEHQESETRLLPTVMEIPSKDAPYKSRENNILHLRVRIIFQNIDQDVLDCYPTNHLDHH